MIDLIVEWTPRACPALRRMLGTGSSGKVEVDVAGGDQVD
jgi:hypothetical protein